MWNRAFKKPFESKYAILKTEIRALRQMLRPKKALSFWIYNLRTIFNNPRHLKWIKEETEKDLIFNFIFIDTTTDRYNNHHHIKLKTCAQKQDEKIYQSRC